MDEQTDSPGDLVYQIPEFPKRPCWQVEHFADFFDNFDLQDIWMEWSIEVAEVLKSLGDRLMKLDVPEEKMIDLIRMASRYPSKPGVPTEEDDADWFLQTLTQTVQQRMHREWEFWTSQVEPLYDSMREIIASCQHACSTGITNEQCVETIDLSNLSISRQALSRYDLRTVFREMLEPDNKPNMGMDAQRQLMALLDVLFEVERQADEMTDAEAEAFVDRMNEMDIDG